MLDSAAFSELLLHGHYRDSEEEFVRKVGRVIEHRPDVVVSQDYMCEEVMLRKTGLTLQDHQRLTIERYDNIRALWQWRTPLMPVLQGFAVDDYLRHLEQYGPRLKVGMWVGVGSVCKRQGDIRLIEELLEALVRERPDLRLHGFGVKLQALESDAIRELLWSADSMAWSFAERAQGGDPNGVAPALAFYNRAMRLL